MLLKSTVQLGLRWFLGMCTQKPAVFFGYVPGYPNPDSHAVSWCYKKGDGTHLSMGGHL